MRRRDSQLADFSVDSLRPPEKSDFSSHFFFRFGDSCLEKHSHTSSWTLMRLF